MSATRQSIAALPIAVLLDTCAVIWLANGDPLQNRADSKIIHAALADGVFVSPVSAWGDRHAQST